MRAVAVLVSLLALLAVFAVVFTRASIEVGEERPWILLYLLCMPAPMALVLVWGLNRMGWLVRACVGVAAGVIVAVLLVQTALSADRIYENPNTFRPILPAILGAEALYLDVFRLEGEWRIRHDEKATRWRALRGTSPSDVAP